MLASFHHISPISSTEELVLPPQLVLSDEKSGSAAIQLSLCGVALNFKTEFTSEFFLQVSIRLYAIMINIDKSAKM